jgi:hypothetical protein
MEVIFLNKIPLDFRRFESSRKAFKIKLAIKPHLPDVNVISLNLDHPKKENIIQLLPLST